MIKKGKIPAISDIISLSTLFDYRPYISICSSALSLTLSIVKYDDFFLPTTSYYVRGSLFIGRACFIISRLVILVVFATQFHGHVFTVCTAHWIAMFVWLHATRETHYDLANQWPDHGTLSCIWIFCHFASFSSSTQIIQREEIFHCIITFIGNGIMILMCNHQTSVVPHYVPAIRLHLILFSFGLIMINLHKQVVNWSIKRDRKRMEQMERKKVTNIDHNKHSNVRSPSANGDINSANFTNFTIHIEASNERLSSQQSISASSDATFHTAQSSMR